MISVRTSIIVVLGVLLIGGLAAVRTSMAQGPADPDTPKSQLDREIEAERETDLVVRRSAAMLSVLEFYGVESPERTKTLEDIAQQLTKLNKGQMNDVIDRLSAAARADDPKLSAAETVEAYNKHNEIMGTLRRLTGAMDSLRSLEQAAAKLEAFAKRQQKVYFITSGVIQLEEEKKRIYPKQLAVKKAHTLEVDSKIQAGDQARVESDINTPLAEIKALLPKLPDRQQERVRSMERRLDEMELVDHVALAT